MTLLGRLFGSQIPTLEKRDVDIAWAKPRQGFWNESPICRLQWRILTLAQKRFLRKGSVVGAGARYKHRKVHIVRGIGIFGHVGNQNLGDEAIFAAVIQNIQCRYPKAKLYGFSIDPSDTERRHKIKAFPIRRIKKRTPNTKHGRIETSQKSSSRPNVTDQIKGKLKKVPLLFAFLKTVQQGWQILLDLVAELRFLLQCYQTLKHVELLIIAGSQQLIDYVGGPWAFPYTIFKWVLLAQLVNTKVAFVSIGAGPIGSPLSRFFIRRSLTLTRYCSYRDDTSRKCIESLGVAIHRRVLPDLAYSLHLDLPPAVDCANPSLPIVGINAVPTYDSQYWLGANHRVYEVYISKLAKFAAWVIQRGYSVLFFSTQLRLDPLVIRDIQNLITKNREVDWEGKIIDKPVSSFADLISAVRMTAIVVASRFHGIVIPFLLNKPVVGIAYHAKTTDLMDQMGQSSYVVDINCFDAESLKARFRSVEANAAKIEEQLRQKNVTLKIALQHQYDQLLDLLEKGEPTLVR